jgi:DNA-3-methyladenine glycosylase I
MKPVVQLERTGCGIASIATLAGVSYAQAKHVANRLGISADDPRLWSETDHVRRLLKEYGFRSARTDVPFTTWEALPNLALLAIKWHEEQGRAFWHWAVFWRGPRGPVVLDSKPAFRRHARTDFSRMKPKWWIPIDPREKVEGKPLTRHRRSISDDRPRCSWAGEKTHMVRYHDLEWGVPVHDDRKHFEMLLLEGAQAGLTWETILLRRGGYRRAFAAFDPKKVARFTAKRKALLLKDPGIIRNRLKIDSAVTNAQAFLAVQKEFGSFDRYVWQFVGGKPKVNRWARMSHVPATSPESDALSKDLKKRGFRFVGSTIVYAYMQAVGMVDDHTIDCFVKPQRREAS